MSAGSVSGSTWQCIAKAGYDYAIIQVTTHPVKSDLLSYTFRLWMAEKIMPTLRLTFKTLSPPESPTLTCTSSCVQLAVDLDRTKYIPVRGLFLQLITFVGYQCCELHQTARCIIRNIVAGCRVLLRQVESRRHLSLMVA